VPNEGDDTMSDCGMIFVAGISMAYKLCNSAATFDAAQDSSRSHRICYHRGYEHARTDTSSLVAHGMPFILCVISTDTGISDWISYFAAYMAWSFLSLLHDTSHDMRGSSSVIRASCDGGLLADNLCGGTGTV
jgi:hypothetical protein